MIYKNFSLAKRYLNVLKLIANSKIYSQLECFNASQS